MVFDPNPIPPPGAKIKVIGVGGGGGNAVNTMIRSNLEGVDFITANTDVQALRFSMAEQKLQVGKELTRGLGAGADPDIGRDAALEDRHEIQQALAGADMVFITAGMGGGTGTGGAAVVAQIARELGALTVAVVTKPFGFEGKRRRKHAEGGIARLRECVDTLITIPNQRLLQVASPSLSMIDAFKMADEVLVNAVRGISDIINIPGEINVDFADVKTIMSCMGHALMGIGSASGEQRAAQAARIAISSPLLEDIDIEGATGILINITAGSDLTLMEVNDACSVVQEAAHEDANIIFGAVIDETLGGQIRVTVIATGFPVDKDETDADSSSLIKPPPIVSPFGSRLTTAPTLASGPRPAARTGVASQPTPAAALRPTDTRMPAPKMEVTPPAAKPTPSPEAAAPASQPAVAATPSFDTGSLSLAQQAQEEAQQLAHWTLNPSEVPNLAPIEPIATLAPGPMVLDPFPEAPAFEPRLDGARAAPLAAIHTAASPEIYAMDGSSSANDPLNSIDAMDALDSLAMRYSPALAESDTDVSFDLDNEGDFMLSMQEPVPQTAPIESARAGAAKDSSLDSSSESPFDHSGVMAVSDIDRKIDEALELAERVRAPKRGPGVDDLEVPAFLRHGMRDLPID